MAASDRIAASFGVEASKALLIRPLGDAALSVVYLDRFYEDGAAPVFLSPDDAFLVTLYLVDVDHFDVWPDRPAAPLKRYPKGSTCLINLKDGAAISVRGRFEALAFHIPSAHLAELTDEAGEPLVDNLATCRGIDDQVIRNLGAALIPMFDMPDEVRDTLLPHIGLAFNAHLAHRYGRSPIQRLPASGRLSATQEKRVKAYMAANLSRDVHLDEIADASGLSTDALMTGFRKTTGQSVEEWLSSNRMTRARSVLIKTDENIAGVAGACGFLDTGAFVEFFSKAAGMTPAEWRLRNRH
ncbi:AraC family transcriptional regulator [Rhizobium sp. PL01]|uniref:helix-turn-helix transcriptional regulator n=1 Tax=Rhizobium sp. PL01 TaxID=3085631 RepID=UPI0029817ABE|nr:AraC family transcriptional regulator [Rhizobium sp. PL01]MDW5316003.1 AraC family transcriptional regulator [Rhizobium sp. PL01]